MKSTGPKTESGKRVASQNAYKGGSEPLFRGLLYALKVAAHDAHKGNSALEYVYREHDQQREYVRQLRKGYKPEVERPSADLRPHSLIWPEAEKEILLAAEPAGAEYLPDHLSDGLVSYLREVAIQYPVLLLDLIRCSADPGL